MKTILNCLLVLIFFISYFEAYAAPFQGTTVTSKGTEAVSENDSTRKGDMCCDRERTEGWAQEISPFESRVRINRILSTGVPIPSIRPGSGQR